MLSVSRPCIIALSSVLVISAFPALLFAQGPRTISGVALDTQGRPLANAQVRVRADFVYGRAEATTGTDGKYAVRDLLRATYRVEAWVQRDYAGAPICSQLAMPAPTDYNSFDISRGAVRNFHWQLTGRIGFSDASFGAELMVWYDRPTGGTARGLEFTLTPTGPLIDGTRGTVLVREVAFASSPSSNDLKDVPLGTYRLSVALLGKDGSRTPLTIATRDNPEFQRTVDVAWTPFRFCGMGPPSGVDPFLVRLEPAG